MNNIRAVFNSEVRKLIVQSNPIQKRRPPKWFFKDELTKQLEQEKMAEVVGRDKYPLPMRIRFKRGQIDELWKGMVPESKRKYYNLSKLDEFRFKEQKSLWIAEIASLITKYGDRMDKLAELIPSPEKLQQEVLDNFKKYQTSYEHAVDSETTKKLYKNVMLDTKKFSSPSLETEELMSQVPDDYKPLLSKPLKPPSPYVLFVKANKSQLEELRNNKYPGYSLKKLCATQWSNLSQEERAVYEKEYSQLYAEYKTSLAKYESDNHQEDDTSLKQAYREKRLFAKSLRKRLREFDVVPVNVRNAFCFFVSENKDMHLTELIEIWRSLDPEKKEKYNRMMKDDIKRYHSEKVAYEEMIKTLLELFDKK